MNDISERIEFLIKLKFPPQGQHSKEKIEAYKAELEAKSALEISVLYAEEQAKKEVREWYANAEQSERDKFLDELDDEEADFAYWCKADHWNLHEASALLLNLEPLEPTDRILQVEDFARSPIGKECLRIETLLTRSIEAGQINKTLEPTKVIQWADQKGIAVPPKLRSLIENQQSSRKNTKASDAPLPESERISLLKMVYGMAIDAYGYRPGKNRNTATGENKGSIFNALDRLGLKTDADTIRNFIKEAAARFGDPTQNRHKP